MIVLSILAALSLIIWIYLVAGRGFFWLALDRDDRSEPALPDRWPRVYAVVPARNEADVIASAVSSLLQQDYPGDLRVLVVDDDSTDGTAEQALQAAQALNAQDRLSVLGGQALPSGWTGKLWAMAQGVAETERRDPKPELLLLTDADIHHAPDNVRRLAARAQAGDLTMVSLMAKLTCATAAEKMLIPAFVFFFDMLYPFGRVNDPKRSEAAAAGGCMLVRSHALKEAGGVAAIRSALIDDCALGRLMKTRGPIWLGLTERARSLRPYGDFGDIAAMVARSAYAQLRYSPWLLAGTVIGMGLTYLAPPLFALLGQGWMRWAGVLSWMLMAVSFQPMLHFYRRSPLWGVALPVIGAVYGAFTLKSAIDVWSGRGGFWKGRVQAQAART